MFSSILILGSFLHLLAILLVLFSKQLDTNKKLLYVFIIWLLPIVGLISVIVLTRRDGVNLMPSVKV